MATVTSLSILNVSAEPLTIGSTTIAGYNVGSVSLTGTLGSDSDEWMQVLALCRQGNAQIVAAS